jgi:hypothetical protein
LRWLCSGDIAASAITGCLRVARGACITPYENTFPTLSLYANVCKLNIDTGTTPIKMFKNRFNHQILRSFGMTLQWRLRCFSYCRMSNNS